MTLRNWRCLAPALLLPALLPAAAHANSVRGEGRSPITKDADTVRSLARAEARRQLVRAMLRATIGAPREGEVSDQVVQNLADQIAPAMITGETAERQGNTFIVTLTAEIDQAAFREQLDNEGIASASQRANGNRAAILIYLDHVERDAADPSRPAEVNIDYTRRTGGTFSDHSVETASARQAAASSSARASASISSSASAQQSRASGAYSSQSAAAYGASGPYGSEAGRARSASSGGYAGQSASAAASREASASSLRASSASSSASAYANRTRVDAETHDDVTFSAHIINQRAPEAMDGEAIMAGMVQGVKSFDVETAVSGLILGAYFNNQVPSYAQLSHDARFDPFLGSLAARHTPFFMGGAFVVTHGPMDAATRQFTCSGQLNATPFASSNGQTIGGAQVRADAMGLTKEACSDNLAARLAQSASAIIGQQVQNHWRKKALANQGVSTGALTTYSVTFRGAGLDMNAQTYLLQTVATLPGVQNSAFVSQSGTQLQINVTYAGAMPLQFALAGKLRENPAFANLSANADGASVLLCVGPCQ